MRTIADTTRRHEPDTPHQALRNALERVAVIVCELELGETSIAYQVAVDLEHDLEAFAEAA